MKIYLASDHAGLALKQMLADFLRNVGHEVEDMGPIALDPKDDYPDFIMPLARRVAREQGSFGIVIGMSGQGEAMAANRVKGARAAVYLGGSSDILTLSREHNDANVLSLGAHFLPPEVVKEAVKLWLATPFSQEERHARRIKKLDA